MVQVVPIYWSYVSFSRFSVLTQFTNERLHNLFLSCSNPSPLFINFRLYLTLSLSLALESLQVIFLSHFLQLLPSLSISHLTHFTLTFIISLSLFLAEFRRSTSCSSCVDAMPMVWFQCRGVFIICSVEHLATLYGGLSSK